MDTEKNCTDRKPNSQCNLRRLTVIGFVFVMLLGITGCYDGSSGGTAPDVTASKVASDGSSNTPANHTDSVSGFLHAPGKETPFSSWCTACHGTDLTGDLGPSCTTCHEQVWTETSPPSSGGGTSNVPSNHIENVSGFLHAPGKETPFSSWCTACHGTDLNGDLGPSCNTCHGQVWTETSPPSSGGRTSNAPSNHTDNVNGFLHASGKDTPYSNWCTACHGADLTGDLGPSCTTCHGQIWTETTPPSSGGRTSNAPSNHTDNVNGFLHAPGKDTPYTSFCSACHGADLTGDTGPSCTACHAQVWTETTPPSGGGGGSGSTDGQALYTANCAGCHGADAATIQDKSVSGINAAIANINSMTGISLSATEIQAISDYLTGNTGGGTGGDPGGPPTSHTNSEDGIMHAPGNDMPYTNGCTACHGPTLDGGAGPSCTNCHGVEWSESPPSGGDTGTGGSSEGQTLYSTYCAGCHGTTGSSLTGRTVNQISTAISNVSSMNNIALSLTELQAIADYLAADTGSGTGGDTGGGSGTVDGQALYDANCALCHGADAATIQDKSVSGITAAMSSIGSMTGINLTTTEIQAISDYLTGNTSGGTGGSGGLPASHTNSEEGVLHAEGNDTPYSSGCTACHGTTLQGSIGPSCFACHGVEWSESAPSGGDSGSGSGTTDGQALYTANCAACHGATGSSINNNSASGISSAINNIGSMNNISLSSTEIQAISDYLTGNTGGSTGGGDTGGLPSNHTNSEGGVLHASGNNYPYTNGCTACHGSTLQGGAGPSCFACHGVEWNESAPSGGDSGGSSGTTDGQALYTANCAACHGATGSSINNNSASGISSAINNIGSMSNISLTSTDIQAISDYLTGASSGSGTGSGGSGTTDGQALYTDNCAACHGSTGSSINNNSASGISSAISNIGSMSNISLSATEVQAISDYLTGNTGGSTGGGDSGGGLPSSHTNSEDGVLHAPGNNYPYSNGCTACHGTTLQGGIGPSCFACHSVEWNESQPSGSDSGSTGSGGTTTDGQALYATYCGACHGTSGANINGRTASAISSAIANIGSMSNISITSAEIQAIADYLAGSTGGSTGGDSSSGGLPSNHTNSEEGAMHAPGNNYPYSNGCTSCHGSNLQGGIGPSCYSCHGQEWIESGSGGSSDGGGSEEDD
jgi:mono/diheme cytochrome c family protein